jgi:hypothetical protein
MDPRDPNLITISSWLEHNMFYCRGVDQCRPSWLDQSDAIAEAPSSESPEVDIPMSTDNKAPPPSALRPIKSALVQEVPRTLDLPFPLVLRLQAHAPNRPWPYCTPLKLSRLLRRDLQLPSHLFSEIWGGRRKLSVHRRSDSTMRFYIST